MKMNKYQCLFTVLVSSFLISPAIAEESWRMVKTITPEHDKAVCAVESVIQTINDGQTETTIKLLYTNKAVYALTKSHIDLSYPETSLRIDKFPRYQVDELIKKDNVVFRKKLKAIRRQLHKGKQAQLSLGFWPTWPKTSARVIKFSLIGFGEAYRQLKICQKKNT